MSDRLPGYSIGFLICLLILVSGRFYFWQQQERVWRDGCVWKREMVVAEPIHVSAGYQTWKWQGHTIIDRTVSKIDIGDRILVEGVVGRDHYGNMILRVTEMKRNISPSSFSLWRVIRVIQKGRRYLDNIYKSTLSEPHASLLSGLVLGKGEKMPEDFYQALVSSGTVHIVAASGFNVTIVAKVIMSLCLRLWSRKKAIGMALIGIVWYVGLAGAGPSVVRAGMMGGLVFAAQAWGREYYAGWGWLLTSLFMVGLWPWLLLDISFQLSVTATAGILWLAPLWLKDKSNNVSNNNFILHTLISFKTDWATTMAATLATMPVVLITFDRLSLISPLTNIAVLWLVPPLMLAGALLLLLGLISFTLARVVASITWPLLTLFITLVTWMGSWDRAVMSFQGMNWWMGVGWWFLLSSLVCCQRNRLRLYR